MKNLFWSFVFLCGVSSYANAEEPKVEVTSFRYAGVRTQAAELCGKVTAESFPVIAKVVVDHKTEKPGIYNTIVGAEGKFCIAVVSYRGQAEVTIWKLQNNELIARSLEVTVE